MDWEMLEQDGRVTIDRGPPDRRSPLLRACDVPPSPEEAALIDLQARLEAKLGEVRRKLIPLQDERSNEWRRRLAAMITTRSGWMEAGA